jgi:hypothetical protein
VIDDDSEALVPLGVLVEQHAVARANHQAPAIARDLARARQLEKIKALGGLCRSFPEWVIGGADYPQPQLTIGALIALGGVLAARRLSYSRMLSSVYCVNLAGSGEGKNRPQSCLQRVLQKNWPQVLGANSFSSGPAFTDSIKKSTAAGVASALILDEYGMQLSQIMGKGAQVHRSEIKQSLTELSTKGAEAWQPAVSLSRGGGVATIVAPVVVILGSTTPEALHAVVSALETADGFLGRHLFFSAQEIAPFWAEPRGSDEIPQELSDAIFAVKKRHVAWANAQEATTEGEFIRGCKPIPVQETPGSAEIFRQHRLLIDVQKREGLRLAVPSSILARVSEFARRIALCLATLSQVDSDVPIIHEEIARLSIEIAESSAELFADSLAKGSKPRWDNTEGQIEGVERVLRQAEAVGQIVTRSYLFRALRSMTPQQITGVIDRLVEQGDVVVIRGTEQDRNPQYFLATS